MTRKEFAELESYMKVETSDSAHDSHHVYRVLNAALDIYAHEKTEKADTDVLIASCLLHDIGRGRQLADPQLCHAGEGGKMAYAYLRSRNWSEKKALHVKQCISSHRYRSDNMPQSIEAKILFDADKLDVCGALGIARTLIYAGEINAPLYTLDKLNNIIIEYKKEETTSFFQEYNYKLKGLYSVFYTERAKGMANERKEAASIFYDSLYNEVAKNYESGANFLDDLLNP